MARSDLFRVGFGLLPYGNGRLTMNETQRNAAADAAIKLGILAALCMLASGYLIGGMQGVGVALGIVATLLCIVVFAYAAGTKT